jgi:hypothetical protein
VLFVSVQEVNDFFARVVDVRLVIISVLDALFRRNEFANINCRRPRVLLQMVSQALQVIIQVVGLSNFVYKLLLLITNLVNLFLALSLFSVQLGSSLCVLFNLDFNNSKSFSAIILRSFDLRVVKKPLGEEVNRVFRVRLVHHCHALGNYYAQVLAL